MFCDAPRASGGAGYTARPRITPDFSDLTDQALGALMDTDGALVHREITERVIKCFFNVYNTLGYGHLERVYQRAVVVALRRIKLRCEMEKVFSVFYEGENVGDYRADLIVNNRVIIETKTTSKIEDAHLAQCISYLKASKCMVALLLNFGPKPEFKRVFLANP